MGKFIIKITKAGFRFNLLATNGQVIATSETYSNEEACRSGIESVRSSCLGAIENQTVENFQVQTHPKFEVYQDKAGEFRFRLKARNGQIVAVGEGYKQLASCLNGIDSVKRNAPDAEVIKDEQPMEIVKPGVKKPEKPGTIKEEIM